MKHDYDEYENKLMDIRIIKDNEKKQLKKKLKHVYNVLNKAAESGNFERCRQACENMVIYIGDI
jgi:hypothetical protein